jgi:hypothetical protein
MKREKLERENKKREQEEKVIHFQSAVLLGTQSWARYREKGIRKAMMSP